MLEQAGNLTLEDEGRPGGATFVLTIPSQPPGTAMRNPRGTTRVALVEDHLLFAESLEIALGMEGYQVRRVPLPDRPSSLGAVLAAVLRAQPRIVLLDLDLGPHGNGVRLIEPLTKAGIAVVVVTGSVERTRWGECLRYGARTVLTKTSPLNDILATVRRLNDGFPVMDRVAREELSPSGTRTGSRTTRRGAGSRT